MILHITSHSAWNEAVSVGEYRGDTLTTEGFIHTSGPQQVVRVANFRFLGKAGLVLLVIDPDLLQAPLKYEDGGEGELFPHIYGPLNVNAVIKVVDFIPDAAGRFDLPEGV